METKASIVGNYNQAVQFLFTNSYYRTVTCNQSRWLHRDLQITKQQETLLFSGRKDASFPTHLCISCQNQKSETLFVFQVIESLSPPSQPTLNFRCKHNKKCDVSGFAACFCCPGSLQSPQHHEEPNPSSFGPPLSCHARWIAGGLPDAAIYFQSLLRPGGRVTGKTTSTQHYFGLVRKYKAFPCFRWCVRFSLPFSMEPPDSSQSPGARTQAGGVMQSDATQISVCVTSRDGEERRRCQRGSALRGQETMTRTHALTHAYINLYLLHAAMEKRLCTYIAIYIAIRFDFL